ncbi:MAG: FecR family protein [Mesonia hippocampi]|uniref:FecR family protein n=1 Tax=Mesonia hippocampi TaxID=1628250 RepID=UPI003F9D3769
MKNRFIKLRNKFLDQRLSASEEQELHTIERYILQKEKNEVFKSDIEKVQIKNEMYNQIEKKINTRNYGWLLKVASVLLIICLGSTAFFFNSDSFQDRVVYENTSTGNTTIVLPDSSTVILKKNSVLTLEKDFNTGTRTVSLQGQAFFEVFRNENSPFKVITGKLVTSVLGTSFNIDQQAAQIKVTVASGLVSVEKDNLKLILTPDNQAFLDMEKETLIKREVNHKLETFWFKDEMELINITLGELTAFLEIHYGASFRYLEPESKNKRISIYINKDDTLTSILRSINYINEVKLKKTANNVVEVHAIK